nr:hypothetical protein [uncultured Bacteroides sp.]
MAILKNIPNAIIQSNGSLNPNTVPIPIPVKALCPNASEKKAILLFTAIVPSNANKGAKNSIANKAFFIKSYCKNEKGIFSNKSYINSIFSPPLQNIQMSVEMLLFEKHLLHLPALQLFYLTILLYPHNGVLKPNHEIQEVQQYDMCFLNRLLFYKINTLRNNNALLLQR